MSLHSILFIASIGFYMIAVSFNTVETHFKKEEDLLQECRYFIVANFFYVLTQIVNLAILILTTYMSAKFSQPLTNFGQSFLLVYQGDLARLSEAVNVHAAGYARD